MYSIEVDHIWKKFQKGETITSLRDQIGYFFKKPEGHHSIVNKEFWAVEDVSFKAEKGEILGIIGANGAGKSTLFNILAGIIMPTEGTFKLNGRVAALIELTAGFHPDFTGRKNVYFNGAVLGMSRKEIDSKFDDIVEFSGIGDFIDTPVKRYSSGMYARLGFSVAAHVNPEVLLVDEVLSVGDFKFQAKCMRKMKDLAKKGTTIILVSHNLAAVQSFCQRVILIDKGKKVKDGDPEEVIPVYQQLVRDSEIEDLKKSFKEETESDLGEHSSGNFDFVEILDNKKIKREVFDFNEPMTVRFGASIHKKIKKPIFFVEIIRIDGVVCCEASTVKQNLGIDYIEGKVSMQVTFSEVNLMPGIYYARVSIWDERFITALIMAGRSFMQVKSEKVDNSESVFRSKTEWAKFEHKAK